MPVWMTLHRSMIEAIWMSLNITHKSHFNRILGLEEMEGGGGGSSVDFSSFFFSCQKLLCKHAHTYTHTHTQTHTYTHKVYSRHTEDRPVPKTYSSSPASPMLKDNLRKYSSTIELSSIFAHSWDSSTLPKSHQQWPNKPITIPD